MLEEGTRHFFLLDDSICIALHSIIFYLLFVLLDFAIWAILEDGRQLLEVIKPFSVLPLRVFLLLFVHDQDRLFLGELD